MKSHFLAVFFFGGLFPFIATSTFAQSSSGRLSLKSFEQKPRLVVVIVIDQFRADYLTRFEKRFLPNTAARVGGFKYLMEQGAYFPFAEYEALQNMTCPGHAMILTGTTPAMTHIPLNNWYDSEKGKDVYCVDDNNAPLVGIEQDKRNGVSPLRLKATTVGDELKLAGHKSRVVAVALKDRSEIGRAHV